MNTQIWRETMIEINEEARIKIKEIYASNPGKYLRIEVDGDGCAGPYFGLSLDEAGVNEEITKVNGIDVLVSDAAQRYSAVTTIKVFLNPDGQDLR
jgi:Fe-S cluster assembly iron-binding protein IscA